MKCDWEVCVREAMWEAISPRGHVHACDLHLGILLDDKFVWFVHPTNNTGAVLVEIGDDSQVP